MKTLVTLNLILFQLLICLNILAQATTQRVFGDQVDSQENYFPYFQEASAKYNIPIGVLAGIGYVESHFKQHVPSNNNDETPASYGIMGLRDAEHFGNTLQKAALCSEIERDSIIHNVRSNILAGACLISKLRDDYNASKELSTFMIENWYPIVKTYSGIPQSNIADKYADEIYNIIEKGISKRGIEIPPQKIDYDIIEGFKSDQGSNRAIETDCSDIVAEWNPAFSGNFLTANRPSDYAIDKIIIHDTEGSYAGAISWFQDANSGVSAHYVVRSSDGQITQMVAHKDIAYHAGNWPYNTNAIGIELEGFVDDPSYFTPEQISSLVKIINCVCDQYGISKNRLSIIGHNQVPNPNDPSMWGGISGHTDPGGSFNYDMLMQLLGLSADYKSLKVTTTSLNARTGPSTDYAIVTTLSQDQEYVSYYQDPSTQWYLIFIPGSNSKHYDVWASNAYLATDQSAQQIEVIGAFPEWLNTRDDPNGNIIDKVSESQRFVYFNTQVDNFGYLWYEYFTPNSTGNSSGWSRGDYLTNVAEVLNTGCIKIFPNPVSSDIVIVSSNNIDVNEMKVVNQIGQVCFTSKNFKLNSNIPERIDLSALKSGVYFIQIKGDERGHISKFIKR